MTEMNEQKLTKVAVISDQAIYMRGLTSLVMSMQGMTLVRLQLPVRSP